MKLSVPTHREHAMTWHPRIILKLRSRYTRNNNGLSLHVNDLTDRFFIIIVYYYIPSRPVARTGKQQKCEKIIIISLFPLFLSSIGIDVVFFKL